VPLRDVAPGPMTYPLRLVGAVVTTLVAVAAGALAFHTFAYGAVDLVTWQASAPALALRFSTSPIAVPFLVILAVLLPAVALWSLKGARPVDSLLVAAFAVTMLLVLVSSSAAAFVASWELMAVASLPLVLAHHDRRDVRRAAFTYLVMSQGGALCIVGAFALIGAHAGCVTFDCLTSAAASLTNPTRDIAFGLALVGFGSKAGLVPLHFWLPRAHPAAPPNGSALLSGAMLKVAIYGLILMTFELVGPPQESWGIALIFAGAVSCVVGVLYAIVEHDLKRLLAYHSVENVGIIVLALGVAALAQAQGDRVVAALAMTAALFHSINHALFKGLLFLGSGTVAEEAGTVDLELLGGLSTSMKWTTPFFLAGCIAISGLPPFNGFASEWMAFRALIAGISIGSPPDRLVILGATAALALTSGLAAACFVKVFGVAFLGRPRRPKTPVQRPQRFDARTGAEGFLAVCCLALGAYPALALAPLYALVAAPQQTLAMGLPPALPATLVTLPLLGAAAALLLARARGVRSAKTWTCGSPVAPSTQYTATAFSKPIRTIFEFFFLPERQRTVEAGRSQWFPLRISYETRPRHVVDEVARSVAAWVQVMARKMRAVQGGRLRYYVLYALAALAIVVGLSR
jgi:hydrogenase-4 component B